MLFKNIFLLWKIFKLNPGYFDNAIICNFYLIVYGKYFTWYLDFFSLLRYNNIIFFIISVWMLWIYCLSLFLPFISFSFLNDLTLLLLIRQSMRSIKLNLLLQNQFPVETPSKDFYIYNWLLNNAFVFEIEYNFFWNHHCCLINSFAIIIMKGITDYLRKGQFFVSIMLVITDGFRSYASCPSWFNCECAISSVTLTDPVWIWNVVTQKIGAVFFFHTSEN